MDFAAPVTLKSAPRSFEEYCADVRGEQHGAVRWLCEPGARWGVPASLVRKVGPDGRLVPFHGDTVTLPLHGESIAMLAEAQSAARARMPGIFADALLPESFHMTLHDLSSGADEEELMPAMEENRSRCEAIFRALAAYLRVHGEYAAVTLAPTRLYPSCNISLVAGLLPASDRDFRALMHGHDLFDEVVSLDYWLRLHVTLLYFLPRALCGDECRNLHRLLSEFDMPAHAMPVDMTALAYQRFADMSTYRTLFSVADFL